MIAASNREVWVLPVAFKRAPVLRHASDVDGGRFQQTVADIFGFRAGDFAVALRQIYVPTRRESNRRRQRGGRNLRTGSAGSRSSRPIGDVKIRYAQARNARHHAVLRIVMHAMQLLNFFVQRHLRHKRLGPRVRVALRLRTRRIRAANHGQRDHHERARNSALRPAPAKISAIHFIERHRRPPQGLLPLSIYGRARRARASSQPPARSRPPFRVSDSILKSLSALSTAFRELMRAVGSPQSGSAGRRSALPSPLLDAAPRRRGYKSLNRPLAAP